MSVPPIQLTALDWVAAAAGTLAEPWKVGSVVSGRVLEYLSETRLILEISGLKVEADPPFSGRMPRQFQARVLRNGAKPVLEVLGRAGQSPPVAAALRARLPQQGGLQPLLADLHALARSPDARSLPEPVRVALARLEASIVDHHDVRDPDVLRDSVRRAGLQLEHALLEHSRAPARMPTAPIDYDLKAAVQRLVHALQRLPQTRSPAPEPTSTSTAAVATSVAAAAGTDVAASDTPPPLLQLPLQPQSRLPVMPASDALTLATGMLKHAQAALSRIEIMQLEAHPSASPQAWMVEIPVHADNGFDVLQIRFEQKADDNDQPSDPPSWTLGFTLEPPGLGAIHGSIRLRGVKVSVDLWAQRDATVMALEEQTSVLSRLLQGSGLQLMQLRVRQGTPLRHTGFGRALLEASA